MAMCVDRGGRREVGPGAAPRRRYIRTEENTMLPPSARRCRIAGAVGLALAASAPPAVSGGFQILEQSASTLGVAHAGTAAAVNDASTVFWNPAGQMLLEGRQASLSLSGIIPSTRFTDSGSSTYSALGDGGQGGERALVPAMFAAFPIAPNLSAGLAINAPMGLATEWSASWAGQHHAVRSSIETLNVNPTLAWRVSDALSLGAGVSYQKLDATFSNRVLVPLGPSTVATGTGTIEGLDWGWGWNVGAIWSPTASTRIAATYRSTIHYTIDGTLALSDLPVAVPSRAVTADVKLPDTFSIAVSHRIDPSLRVLADWSYTGWSSIEDLRIVDKASGAAVSTTRLGFSNAWRVGVGGEYAASEKWLLRAGVAYDTTPVQDAYRTPRLPDSDRTWLAFGARWAPSRNAPWWFDVGYAHLFMKDAPSELPYAGAPAEERARGALVGRYKGSVDILSAQVGVRF
jgi:long-chain fatty acid transport protein